MEALEIAKLDKYQIVIRHDKGVECPFENWDDCVPTMYEGYSRNQSSKDFSNGEIEKYIRSVYTDNVIRRHQKKIADIFNLDLTGLDAEEKENEFYDCFRSMNIEQLTQLCELKKIPYLNWDSKGYCQGDMLNALSVITPKFLEITGCDIKNAESILNGNKELFDAWAWGDVYSFTVYYYEDGKFDEYGHLKAYYEEAEEIDSCGGFFGSDYKTNGMLDYISIDELNKEDIFQLLEDGFNNILY